MKKVNQAEFKEIIKKGKFVVDFYADWCGPCKMIAPHLESLEKELNADGVEILKINVDENGELAEEMKIQFIPFIAVFADGAQKNSFSGYKSVDDLREFIKNSLAI